MKNWAELYPVFRDRLIKLISDNHLTYEALAEKSGVSLSTIKRYVKDTVAPRSDHAITLAEALNVSVDYLLGVSDDITFDKERLSKATGLTKECIDNLQKKSMINDSEPFSVSNIADVVNVFSGYIFDNERNQIYFDRTMRNIRVLSDIVKDQKDLENVETTITDELFNELKTEVTKRGLVMVSPELALRFYVDDLSSILKSAVTKEVTDYMEDQARYFRKRSFTGR